MRERFNPFGVLPVSPRRSRQDVSWCEGKGKRFLFTRPSQVDETPNQKKVSVGARKGEGGGQVKIRREEK